MGGWQWQRTIYVPLRDPSGQVIAAPFVGVPEAAFAELAWTTSISTGVALIFALLSVAGPLMVAHRFADRMRQRDEGLAALAGEVQTVGSALARDGRQAAAAAADAQSAAEEVLRSTEQAGESTGQARGRMRDLEVTLARVNAGTDEQTRTLRHAGRIVAAGEPGGAGVPLLLQRRAGRPAGGDGRGPAGAAGRAARRRRCWS